MTRNPIIFGTLLLGALLAPSAGVEAQEEIYPYGYLSHLEGELSLQRASELTPEPGEVNLPVLPGDRIWTQRGSRAEVRIADAVVLRLNGETKLDFVELGETILLRLWNGNAILQLDEAAPPVRIDSPAGSLDPSAPGVYRIDVREAESLAVSVVRGSAQVASNGGAVLVQSGETSRVFAGELPEIPVRFNTAQLDDFDRWSEARDRSASRGQDVIWRSLPHAVRDDAQVLDDYGTWRHEPSYGYVWYPQVSVGWAPYRYGRWCDTPWGFTWVSHDPWGWTPHHYGRWGFNHHGWYWIPGAVFSPAWVSFAVGPAWIGWSPLGFHNAPVFAFHKRGFHRGDRFKFHHRGGWNFTHRNRFRSRRAVWASDDDRGIQDLVSAGGARAELLEPGAVLDRDLNPRTRTAVPRARSAILAPLAPVQRSDRTASRGAVSPWEPRTQAGGQPARDPSLRRGRERDVTPPRQSPFDRAGAVRARTTVERSTSTERRDVFRSRTARDRVSPAQERPSATGAADRRPRGFEPGVTARRGREDAATSTRSYGPRGFSGSEVTSSRGSGFRPPGVDAGRGRVRSRESSLVTRAPSGDRRVRGPAESAGRGSVGRAVGRRSSGSESVGRVGAGGAASGRRMAAPGSSSSSRGSAAGVGSRGARSRSRPPKN